MDEREMEEILYRLDERTQRIDEHITRLEGDVKKNESDIDDIQATVKRNTTMLGGIGTAATGVLIWASDKILKLV